MLCLILPDHNFFQLILPYPSERFCFAYPSGDPGIGWAGHLKTLFGSQDSGIGLATSRTLQPGSWTDHGLVLETGANETYPLSDTNAIDPAYFHDPLTGENLLNYGSFWSDIWQFQLAQDLKTVLWKPPPVHLSFDPVGTNPEEGSFMSYNDGWYYVSLFSFSML